jgi:hypothetical protein
MAVLHHATLTPTKIEILAAWVGAQPWGLGVDPADVEIVGAYRFDDPDGAVGIETFLLSGADGALLQVPVTYRDAPLPDADEALLAVAEHSVLGSRWVYDASVDEVYARGLLMTMVEGGHQAAIEFATEAGLVPWKLTTFVQGRPGSTAAALGDLPESAATVLRSGATTMVLLRRVRVGHDTAPAGAPTLWGTWPGQDAEALLAWAGTGPT